MVYDDSKEKILRSLDIKEVVFRYAGAEVNRNNRCACPIHGGEHSNFTIYPKTNSFYCFTCGAGGDLIKFVSIYLNIIYSEAIERLDADYSLNLFEKSHKTYNALVKEAQVFKQKQLEKEALKRAQTNDYNLMINYFKWLIKQPQTREIKSDMAYMERLLDRYLDLEKNPINFDVKARIAALYSKHRKEENVGREAN